MSSLFPLQELRAVLTSFRGSVTKSIPSRFFYLGCSICPKMRLLVSRLVAKHRSTCHPRLEPSSPSSMRTLIQRLWGQYRLVSLNLEALSPFLQRTNLSGEWGCHASPHPEVSSPPSSASAPPPQLRKAPYKSQKRVTVSSLPLSGGFTLYQFTDILVQFWKEQLNGQFGVVQLTQ